MNHIILSIPISILTIYLVTLATEYMTEELKYNDKIQKGFIINFIIGLLLIFLSYSLFSKYKILENNTMKYSTFISGVYFTIISILINWTELENTTKIILMTMSIIVLISYSYQIDSNNNKQNNDDIIDIIDDDEIYDIN
jgi:putative effector of murein hydrolase